MLFRIGESSIFIFGKRLRVEKLKIALACACAFAATLWLLKTASAQIPPQKSEAESVPQAQPLTPAERRGRAIYLRGETSNQRPITALVGEIEVPATTVNCAGCHGRRGEGKTEGGVAAGNLTWSNLTKSYGHTHPTGRKHGPFSESSFINAVVRGVDPAGNNLLVAMPRYHMTVDDMSDLLAYIRRLEFDRDPGLTADSINIGVPLSSSSALAEMGQAIRQAILAYFEDLNARGGIYNRKIKVHFTEPGRAGMLTSTQNEIFAFIGGVSAGADKEMAAFAREEEIPLIGPATLRPVVEQPPNRYVFYLLPGVSEQAIALMNFADEQLDLKKVRSAVLFSNTELPSAAAEATLKHAQQAAFKEVTKLSYSTANFDANRLAQQLKADGTAAVFMFGSGSEIENFLRAASALAWTPHVFSLGIMASRDLATNLPSSFSKKMFLGFPTVPADVTPEGMSEYRSLAEKHKLPPRYTSAQFAALAAAKTFVEGLKRTGADLSREQFVTALEGFYNFDTGFTPKLIFGPNRRVGAAGAYVITIDSSTKNFVSVSGWVAAQK